ncbi:MULTISPECIES: hypothetical protein [Pseudomonas]|uniref:Uncharacterized protein n=1 Tax=Pseudomonas mosselii TaxID=78327 RepID=A0A5R8YLK1_9PSED|nr:hypothetical protein [Pseudomonas mosselii]TLP54124.1 hypothetical protein FEM01_22310 [Pseudomonas mosselii]
MTLKRLLSALLLTMGLQCVVQAAPQIFTAHISARGYVVKQSPDWITEVKRYTRQDITEYTLLLDEGVTQGDPTFCSMSPIDVGTYERLIHGQGKVIGAASAGMVRVATRLVGLEAPGDGAMQFQLMCVR